MNTVHTMLPKNVVCASYARFSSNNQSADSVTDQQRKLRDYAERQGWHISPELQFADEAVSGTKLDRTGLNALMAAAREKQFSVLLLESLSRFARQSAIGIPLLKELTDNCGVRIISVNDGVDSSSALWGMALSILSSHHEQFIADLSKFVFRGQESALLSGYALPDTRFGYGVEDIPGTQVGHGKTARCRKRYIVIPEQAEWVRKVFHWFVHERWSLRRIAQELTRNKVPTDHRSRKESWHYQAVARMLGCEKYKGVWSWGKTKVKRDPLSGKVSQEPRSPEEIKQWVRRMPDLQIIDDELWEAAQVRLAENRAALAHVRREQGKLKGIDPKDTVRFPRHMLAGLILCGGCGARFHLSGDKGKYLLCPNVKKGTCPCNTHLSRDLAERKIVNALTERVWDSQAWLGEVKAAFRARWAELLQENPTERVAVAKQLKEVEAAIDQLVDKVEKRQGTDAVIARLAKREAEREVLLKRKEKLERIDLESLPEPTDEWVREQFGRLADVLRTRGSAAAHVLRSLIGGRIVVTEVLRPGWRQPHWQGVIQVTMTGMKGAVGQTHLQSSALADGKEALDHPQDEPIVIDFKEDRGEDVADEAKALWDQGLRLKDIGEKLGLGHKAVSNALDAWYVKRGRERPEPLKCKGRLKRTPVVASIADEAMALVRQGETYDEIGRRLGTNRAKVARAVAYWHVQRGLPVPDPRKRRKSESLKDDKSSPDTSSE